MIVLYHVVGANDAKCLSPGILCVDPAVCAVIQGMASESKFPRQSKGKLVVAPPDVWIRSTRRRREAGLAGGQSPHKHFVKAGEMHDVPSNINPRLAPFGAVEMGRLRDNDAVMVEKDDPAGALMAQSDEELVILDAWESAMQSTGALGALSLVVPSVDKADAASPARAMQSTGALDALSLEEHMVDENHARTWESTGALRALSLELPWREETVNVDCRSPQMDMCSEEPEESVLQRLGIQVEDDEEVGWTPLGMQGVELQAHYAVQLGRVVQRALYMECSDLKAYDAPRHMVRASIRLVKGVPRTHEKTAMERFPLKIGTDIARLEAMWQEDLHTKSVMEKWGNMYQSGCTCSWCQQDAESKVQRESSSVPLTRNEKRRRRKEKTEAR